MVEKHQKITTLSRIAFTTVLDPNGISIILWSVNKTFITLGGISSKWIVSLWKTKDVLVTGFTDPSLPVAWENCKRGRENNLRQLNQNV